MDSAFYPPNHLEETCAQLLERVRRNDADAWRQLVHLYGPVVRYWIRRAGVARDDQADVFQEVFAAICRKAADFQPQPGVAKFRAWLKTVAYSKIADYFRRQGKQPRAPGGTDALLGILAVADAHAGSDTTDGGQRATDYDDHLLTRHALHIVKEEFRDSTWQAFWRTAVDGCAANDVAQELNVSTVAVRKAKSRVLARLREFLDDSAEPLDDLSLPDSLGPPSDSAMAHDS